jgi:hypothetical protein
MPETPDVHAAAHGRALDQLVSPFHRFPLEEGVILPRKEVLARPGLLRAASALPFNFTAPP